MEIIFGFAVQILTLWLAIFAIFLSFRKHQWFLNQHKRFFRYLMRRFGTFFRKHRAIILAFIAGIIFTLWVIQNTNVL